MLRITETEVFGFWVALRDMRNPMESWDKSDSRFGDSSVKKIVVEHRDRLARFGVEYIEAALQAQDRSLIVAEAGEQKLDLVQDFIDVVTSMCARIYGRRAASNRAKRALAAASEET